MGKDSRDYSWILLEKSITEITDMPILSITIAAYNAEEFLSECLDSLVETQRIQDLDIIIVNDGSTDGTSVIAHKYADIYPKQIRVFDQDNKGLGAGFNVGIRNAKGKYWLSLDADDKILPDEFNDFIELLKVNNSDIVSFRMKRFGLDSSEQPGVMDQRFIGQVFKIDDVMEKFLLTRFIHTEVFNTEFLRKNRIVMAEEPKLYNDTDLMIQTFIKGSTCLFTNHLIYAYRVSNFQSTSIDSLRKHVEDFFKMINALMTIYEKNRIESRRRNLITNDLAALFKTGYFMAMFEGGSRIEYLNRLVRKEKEVHQRLPLLAKIVSTNQPVLYLPVKIMYTCYKAVRKKCRQGAG